MASVETVRLVDDLDGSDADETVEFAVDGRRYEVDLSSENARKLREVLSDYVSAARTLAGARYRQARRPSAAAASTTTTVERREHNRAVRLWARSQGISISERGRIPAQVVESYEQEAGRSGSAPSLRSIPDVQFQSAI